MSKGLGEIEREVLEALAKAPDEHTESVTLAAKVRWRDATAQDLLTNAERVAVRRALATLKRKGLVEGGGRHWRIVPDILKRLAGDAKPGHSMTRSYGAMLAAGDPLADHIRHLFNLPPGQRARRAADLNAAIAARAARLKWEAETDAAEGSTR